MKGGRFLCLCWLMLNIVCITLTISQPSYSHPGRGPSLKGVVKYTEMADRPRFSHQSVTKRQISDDTALKQRCNIQDWDRRCDSGYYQSEIDAYLYCGQMDDARDLAMSCAQNEMGEYCGTVYYKVENVESTLDYIDGNCSSALSSGSCSANCREQLQLLIARLGCCSYSLLNNSFSSLSNRLVTDQRLWSMCNVSPSTTPGRIQPLPAARQ